MKRPPHSLRGPARAQIGVITVELALMLPVMCLMLAAMFAFGQIFLHYNVLHKATSDAARYLATVPVATVTNGVTGPIAANAARQIVIDGSSAAGVNPVPTMLQIQVFCDGVQCGSNAAKPSVIRVAVNINYNNALFADLLANNLGFINVFPIMVESSVRYVY